MSCLYNEFSLKVQILINTLVKLIHHPFLGLHPVAAYLILLVAIVCISGKLTQRWTKFLLVGIQEAFGILIVIYNFDAQSKAYLRGICEGIPKDIRTVHSRLQLVPPPSTTYATCPNTRCSFIYKPDADGRWPEYCENMLSDTERCSTAILKGLQDPLNLSKRHPVRPYVLYDIKVQVAELVVLEPTASQLRGRLRSDQQESLSEGITDIFHGRLVREFQGPLKGPNGTRHWFDAPEDEIRLLFSLSVDWMNPYGVKAAGVSASVGVIALCCINLPIMVRYKPENLFLVGLIPGPHEPVLDTINHFLRPIIDDFLILWERGLKLQYEPNATISCKYKLVRAAIIALVTDMPASKKISGNLSHSADAFCSRCDLRKDDINNLDVKSWPERTCEDHRKAAFEWLHASLERRKVLEKEFGIRFSELDRLPYFDPPRQAVVDIMHNLFLGIIKRHFLSVLGMADSSKLPGGPHLYQQASETKVRKGRLILNSRDPAPVISRLKNGLSWAELYALSLECGIDLNPRRGKNSKGTMAEDLDKWVSNSNFEIFCKLIGDSDYPRIHAS